MNIIIINCIWCNKEFTRNHSRNTLCSKICVLEKKNKRSNERYHRLDSPNRKPIIKNCLICSVEYRARMNKQKCCGEDCRKIYNREDHKIRTRVARKDINNRIAENLRSRISRAVKRDLKGGSAVDDLGCSIEELKRHLEAKFTDSMSWDNYGEWHIDHKKALANFDLSNKEEFKTAANYKNLQPMWAFDNISKGKK